MDMTYAVYWAVVILIPFFFLIKVLHSISDTLKELVGEIEDE
jgi:uncharacterized protein YoxC